LIWNWAIIRGKQYRISVKDHQIAKEGNSDEDLADDVDSEESANGKDKPANNNCLPIT
jgi:hypothetical protein